MNDSQPLRLSILAIVAIALFTALFSRLWFLQVMAAPDYSEQAVTNRTRTIVVEGPRGRIIDREGRVLADNRESLVVTVDANELRTLAREGRKDEVLAELSAELARAGTAVSPEQIQRSVDTWRGDPFRPVVVAEDVNPDLWVTISERTAVLPGVGVEWRYVREYPYGSLAAHVLGYVGEVNETELRQVRDSPKPYRGGDTIGKAGVEQIFEDSLRGQPGRVVFEVDSVGRVGRIINQELPTPGADVHLAIDIDLQGLVERSLVDELARARRSGEVSNNRMVTAPAGSAVVVDPRNGEVLAMASYPTFDPNELVAGVTEQRYRDLTSSDFYTPLSNRAVRSPYAPGSTFKLFSGYTSAASGLRPPGQWFDDNGSHTLRNCDGRCTFYNANRQPHGSVDLRRALMVSSNVYFYGVGEDFWVQRNVYGTTPIQDVAATFGLGERTGVALPLEEPGILTTPELKQERHEANPNAFPYGNWLTGDSVNLAIGQADIGVTPLQLANAYATFGNGGTRYAPNIARAVIDPVSGETLRTYAPRITGEIELIPSIWQTMTEGLVGVTQRDEGTAARVFAGFPHSSFAVAGKTGTAQVTGKADSSLFAAWAPAAHPRYAIAVVVEEGGFGSRVATPVARRILEPLAERDNDGIPLVRAPRRGETVVDDVPEFEVGGALD
jgi:penicillin-binding protein 2